MNGDRDSLKAFRQQQAFLKLANELAEYNPRTSDATREDIEMLSMVFDEVLNGQDITTRFPSFYRKLLDNASLRQAFLDLMETIQDEKSSQVPFPAGSQTDLAFLADKPKQPTLESAGKDQWRITWQRTIKYLQSIFSPPELAYRMDPSLYEDPWVTLLRGETRVNDCLFSVLLDCSLAQNSDSALAVTLNVATTFDTKQTLQEFPLQASLNWGAYNECITVANEGRIHFPNVPLAVIFDDEVKNVTAELNLTLETIS